MTDRGHPDTNKKAAEQARGPLVAFFEKLVEAIREYLDDLEDLHLAEQRLKDIHEGKSQTVPLEKVMKEHGLAD